MLLSTRITLLATIIIAIVASVIITASVLNHSESDNRFNEAAIKSQATLWQQIISSQLDTLESDTSSLTRNYAALTALRTNTLDQAREALLPTYKRLKASDVITQLQLTDKNGDIIFSEPSQMSGRTVNPLILESMEVGELKGGIAVDNDGIYRTSLTIPLYHRGQLIGVGVLSKDLDASISEFKSNSSSDLAIFNANDKITYATDATLFDALKFDIPSIGEHFSGRVDMNSQSYSTTITSIVDSKGSPILNLASVQDNTESYRRNSHIGILTVAIVLITLTISLGLLFWLIKTSLKPLQLAVTVMQRVAEGDLTVEINTFPNNETGVLMRACANMVERLDTMMREISGNSRQLAAASEEVSKIAQNSQESIGQQSSETDVIVTAVTEMAATIKEVAQNANSTAEASASANIAAQDGQQVVAETIKSIRALSQTIEETAVVIHQLENEANDIDNIIEVIQSIAEQTNLLALNAAIEAARAGEQGRGFAVVADEVRSLATRTKESTTEIQSMISKLQTGSKKSVEMMTSGQQRVKESVTQAELAVEALSSITGSISSIADMSTQIASATEEQSVVAEDINKNVMIVSELANSTFEGTEHTTKATKELNQLSNNFDAMIGQFKI